MIVKKLALLTGVIATVGISSLAVMNVASAESGSTTRTSMVEKIAAKFNLNKADVQKVFDEDRKTHEADMQAKYAERLTQAVKDGKITETQKTQLVTKESEMHTFMDSLKDKTQAERKTAMEIKRVEVEKWAKDNGISTDLLGGPGAGGKMDGRGMGKSMKDTDSSKHTAN